MAAQRPRTHYYPLLTLLPQHASKPMSLKDEQAAARRHSEHILGEKNSITAAVYVESMRLIVLPFSVDVLGVSKVEEGGSLHAVLLPVGYMKGEVIIHQDTQTMPL